MWGNIQSAVPFFNRTGRKIVMKTKDFSKKVLVALTMMMTLALNAEAQKSTKDQRVMAFQTVMAMHDKIGRASCRERV